MIKGQLIKGIARLIAEAKLANDVMFVIRWDSVTPVRKKEIGIHYLQCDKDSILASDIGKASRFNVNGREVKRKDLPLIKKVIPPYRIWKDWNGREYDRIQYRIMDVYPIDFISPPSEKLSLKENCGVMYIAARKVKLLSNPASVMHLANLLLEYFGGFEIFDVSRDKILTVAARQLQWEVLPQEKYPGTRLRAL